MEKKRIWWWNNSCIRSFFLGVVIILFLSQRGGALPVFVIEGGESFPFLPPIVESSYKEAQLCFQRVTGYSPCSSFRIKVLSPEISNTLPSWVAAFSRGSTIYLRSPLLLFQRGILSSTLAHEFFHVFVESFGWQLPSWFEEGMASFFFPTPGEIFPEGAGEFYEGCQESFRIFKEKIGEENLPSFFSTVQEMGFEEAFFIWTGEKEEDFGKHIDGE
ncbi:MAG: hypothetical protein PHI00_05515 [Atribacterota bacterium]|nr:hypothetical protein [Atribacterota bacterium]HQD33177.1 hypothetical protein [Candidatus Atribacteria bacterium]